MNAESVWSDLLINGISPTSLWTYLFVFVALCGVFSIIMGAVEKLVKWRESKAKPLADVKTDIMAMLANDKHRLDAQDAIMSEHTRRLDKLENRADTVDQGQKVQCKALMALLEHELHNGNADQMHEASQELNDYLLNK